MIQPTDSSPHSSIVHGECGFTLSATLVVDAASVASRLDADSSRAKAPHCFDEQRVERVFAHQRRSRTVVILALIITC